MSTGLGMEALFVSQTACTMAAVSSNEPMTPPWIAGMIGLPISLVANGISSTTWFSARVAVRPSQEQYGTAASSSLMSGETPSRAARAKSSIGSGLRFGREAQLGHHERAGGGGDRIVRGILIGAAPREDDLAGDLDALADDQDVRARSGRLQIVDAKI